jgi:hypothetical protein
MAMKRRSLTSAIALSALCAAALAACLLPGCSTSTGPEGVEVPDVHYFARTSPDSVMANLKLAYENEHLDHYMDCLAEDFTFYPSPQTVAEYEWIPESWGRYDEFRIHQEMFEYSVFVRDIFLSLLPQGDPVVIPGPTPEDPVMYEYVFGIDLRVDCQDSIQYVATAPSLFVLQVDLEGSAAEGDTLWEIVDWYDLDEDGRPVLPTTWGELKALFLDID